MSNIPIISIVGPTAVGKTDYALKQARKLLVTKKITAVEIISVDSKQVYKGLEILTGADVPAGWDRQALDNSPYRYEYYQAGNVPIRMHGISIISTAQDWSVAHFKKMALSIIAVAQKNNAAVILVGGTGLYHQQLFADQPELYVPPNEQIRDRAEQMSVSDLQQWTAQEAPEEFELLNNSDRHNPRRLVRVLEKKLGMSSVPSNLATDNLVPQPYKKIGLYASLPILEERINIRVQQRFVAGAVDEVRALIKEVGVTDQAMATLGVSEIATFLKGKQSQESMLSAWALHEFQYAKRQLTWWKKNAEIKWFDTSIVSK